MNYHDDDYNAPFSIKVWKKIVPYAMVYKKELAITGIFMLICAGCDISYPLFLRYAINNFIIPGSAEGLAPFAVLICSMVILQGICVFTFIKTAIKIETHIGKDLRRAVFVHLQTLPFSYYNKTPVGYMLARTMSDTSTIGERIAWSMVDLVWSAAYMIGVFGAMLVLNWKLALIVIAVIPVLSIITWFFQINILKVNRAARKINSKMTGAMNEGIVGAKTSKTLVIEEQNAAEFREITAELKLKNTHSARLRGMFYPLVYFVGSIATSIVLATGSNAVLKETLLVGTLLTFINYSLDIFNPIQNVASTLTDFIACQANVERVTNLLELKPEIVDTPDVLEKYGDNFMPKHENWEELTGHIEFKNVTFRYPDGDVNILENFDLDVPAGSYIAIVGETGAGKSTLVNLVCRFFEPTEGEVLIDGRDIRERSQLWLHSHLGYVLQNPHLFSGTIRENIRYGRLDATDEEVELAAKIVSADQIIEKLEGKWDAEVGEGGDRLSTGQKQLMSLARAVLADPRIFILDEATSSIDTETEQLIQRAITTLLTGRTSFVIAHRLSTIRGADQILVVHDGKIVERGTHPELMRQRGRYFELFTRQFEDEAAV